MKLNSRWVLFTFLIYLLPHLMSCAGQQKGEEANRPNVIFILSDDHDKTAISSYGERFSEVAPTPNLDRLANQGMRFDRAFVTNSICSPSRAVILTGKHSHLNGVLGNEAPFDGSQMTFPKLFQDHGYQTALVGKWHLKSEPTGFDYWSILHGGNGQGSYYNPSFNNNGNIEQDTGYVTNLITNKTLDWLENSRKKNSPFLLMYQHKTPHRSWHPDISDIDLFKDKYMPEPATLYDDYETRTQAIKRSTLDIENMNLVTDLKLSPDILEKSSLWETFGKAKKEAVHRQYEAMMGRLTEKQQKEWKTRYRKVNKEFLEKDPVGKEFKAWVYQRYMKSYLQSVRSMDENIGRLLDYLEQSGLRQNTIVVYTSDQGFFLGEHGLFDKRFMYETSFSTPLLVRWPEEIQQGRVDKHLVQNLDLAPTMLDMAGISIPDGMQGKSLVPLLKEKKSVSWRDALYYHYYEEVANWSFPHYGIRTERYKLIHFYTFDEWELYDLEEDSLEVNNVYADPEYEDIRKKLKDRLFQLQEKYNDHTVDTLTVGKDLG